MKVKVVRQIITTTEDIYEMSPSEYCELRANLAPLRTDIVGKVKIEVKEFEPLSDDDIDELRDYWFR